MIQKSSKENPGVFPSLISSLDESVGRVLNSYFSKSNIQQQNI